MAKLGNLTVGSTVNLNVDGVLTEFIVVHQGLPSSDYDDSCNGTWLLMKDIYTQNRFSEHSYGGRNIYEESRLDNRLNNVFFPLLDEAVQSVVKQVKIPYTQGGGNGSLKTGADGLSTKVFALSYAEVGFTNFTNNKANVEGASLSYFYNANNSARIAYFEGDAVLWILRSPRLETTTNVSAVSVAGAYFSPVVSETVGYRPTLILPSNIAIDENGQITEESSLGHVIIGGINKELTGAHVNIGGVWKDISEIYMNIGGTWKEMP
ncbi:MAG: hypothetical protein J6D42_10190 [Clostridia bacterium]|nr:hypothetical protein [Clostridia bacterium]